MSEPVYKQFTVPENCPKSIELMSIWAQAAEEYKEALTDSQFKAALIWLESYIYIETSHD